MEMSGASWGRSYVKYMTHFTVLYKESIKISPILKDLVLVTGPNIIHIFRLRIITAILAVGKTP